MGLGFRFKPDLQPKSRKIMAPIPNNKQKCDYSTYFWGVPVAGSV